MSRLVIGLGNSFRSDDGVGLEVASRVHNADTRMRPAASLDLIELWDGADEVVVIDAMRSGRPPGAVERFEPLVEPMADRSTFASTHGLGLLAAIDMGRALGRLPERLIVYGVEVANVEPGDTLTPAVASAAVRLAEEIDHA